MIFQHLLNNIVSDQVQRVELILLNKSPTKKLLNVMRPLS
jgi:hypothetical protein